MELTGERFIPGWEGIVKLEHLNRYYFVVNQIDLKNKKVLDIASGEGYGSNILSNYAQNVIGVDISNEAVEHAKGKYSNTNLKYIQGDAAQIPLDDNSVDIVVSFETIEHHDKHNEMISEIKRVLKVDGVLVISSPDKYYYTDLPQINNKFHVKELYFNEFKNLMSAYFTEIFFFSQRTFTGSIIALDEENNSYKKPLVINKLGENHPLYPIYNIAIATNDKQFNLSNQVILYTEEDKAITRVDIEAAVHLKEIKIKKTITWRVGKFILFPLKFLKNLF